MRTLGTLAPSARTLTFMVAVRESAFAMVYSRVRVTVAEPTVAVWLTISRPCPDGSIPAKSTVALPNETSVPPVPDVPVPGPWGVPPVFITKSSAFDEYVSFLHVAPL
jgi:hypothetical protein